MFGEVLTPTSCEIPRLSPRSSAGVSPCAAFVALAGSPGAQAGPPSRHRAPAGPVVRAAPARGVAAGPAGLEVVDGGRGGHAPRRVRAVSVGVREAPRVARGGLGQAEQG